MLEPQGTTRLWLPVPSVNSDWQRSLESSFSSNGRTQLVSDARARLEVEARTARAELASARPELARQIASKVIGREVQG